MGFYGPFGWLLSYDNVDYMGKKLQDIKTLLLGVTNII